MPCSSIQSVSSPRMQWKYDVFVSFRGEDTRNNFTDHLFGALHKNRIVAFKDDTNLEKGLNISSELLQAIKESHILIVIFSRNYASSTWCLQELANIVDCIHVQGQIVLPIFYDVSPTEVRKQTGDYEKSFLEHEERFKENLEEVQRWRGALTQVANLSGWDIKDKPQYEEIRKIIKKVTCLLGNKTATLPGDIVGMHSRVEELENHTYLDSDDDVPVVEICEMGRIGKTTLAKVSCTRVSYQFVGCSSVDDVSKIYRGYGPTGVQKHLLSQALAQPLNFAARNEAINWIQRVRAHFGFGPLCVYLSINYMDLFISAYKLPKASWVMQLMAVACLSLAAKVEETDVPQSLDLQIGESKFVFEEKTIQRMEFLVQRTLKWRMQAITPFTFIEYFLSKINDDKSSLSSLISQSTELILSIIKGLDFLEFKPSEIAAAVATCVVGETQAIDSRKSISTLIQYVEKERFLKCVEKVQGMCVFTAKDSNDSSVSSHNQ